jgi:hypothetical protein
MAPYTILSDQELEDLLAQGKRPRDRAMLLVLLGAGPGLRPSHGRDWRRILTGSPSARARWEEEHPVMAKLRLAGPTGGSG